MAVPVDFREVDVVVAALHSDLSYLTAWQPLLRGCHLIVVQGSDFQGPIHLPPGFADADIYTLSSIGKLLGPELSAKLNLSGANSVNFGYLMSKRRYVFTMEAGCLPALDTEGFTVNPIEQHLVNLSTPAAPFFFNTLYDPFREGADFVRGYPFSLREGIPTAVSQGSWSERYVDAVLTVPQNVLFTFCAINLAFDRHRVGALLFQPPQLSDDAGELFAGLCCKTVCDYFPWGVKSGLPYVRRGENTQNVGQKKADGKLELIADFFRGARLRGNPLDVEMCYLEIAQQVEGKLASVDPVFKEVAASMQAWIQAWKKLSPLETAM